MAMTNGQVAERLGVSKSTASRMRSGHRIGSPAVLVRVAEQTDYSIEQVMAAAVAARAGDTRAWVDMFETAFGAVDEEPESLDVAV